MGSFATGGNYRDADPRLVAIAQAAAARSPYNVVLFSGERGNNSRSQHYGGNAIDIVLIDPQTGREIPNLGAGGDAFSAYESFARTMRATQQEIAPDLAGTFRWGGYFGPTGLNPTGLDLMHFDLGPTQNMALGTWEGGLNERGRAVVAQAGNGRTYSASGQTTAPMAYTASPDAPAGQGAIAAAAGPGAGVAAAPPAPGSQRLFRPRSEAIEARQAGGTPRLDELSNIIRARRMGDTPLLDRLRSFVETWRQNRQSDAPTPPAPIPYARNGGGAGQSAPASTGNTYTVRSGDTLSAIAARLGTTVQALAQANGIANPDRIQAGAVLTIPGQAGAPQAAVPLPRGNISRPGVEQPQSSGMGSYNAAAPMDYSLPIGSRSAPPITAPQPGALTAGSLTPSGPYNPPAPMNFGLPIAPQSAPSFGAPPPGSLMTGGLTPSGPSGFGNPNPMANMDFGLGIGARGPSSVPTPSANPTLGPMLAGYQTPGNGVGVPTTPVSRGVLPAASPPPPQAPNIDIAGILASLPQMGMSAPGWGPQAPTSGPGAGGRPVQTRPAEVDRGQMFGVQNGFMPAMRNDFGDMDKLPAFAETNPYVEWPRTDGRAVPTTTPTIGTMLPFNRNLPFPDWWRRLMGAGV